MQTLTLICTRCWPSPRAQELALVAAVAALSARTMGQGMSFDAAVCIAATDGLLHALTHLLARRPGFSSQRLVATLAEPARIASAEPARIVAYAAAAAVYWLLAVVLWLEPGPVRLLLLIACQMVCWRPVCRWLCAMLGAEVVLRSAALKVAAMAIVVAGRLTAQTTPPIFWQDLGTWFDQGPDNNSRGAAAAGPLLQAVALVVGLPRLAPKWPRLRRWLMDFARTSTAMGPHLRSLPARDNLRRLRSDPLSAAALLELWTAAQQLARRDVAPTLAAASAIYSLEWAVPGGGFCAACALLFARGDSCTQRRLAKKIIGRQGLVMAVFLLLVGVIGLHPALSYTVLAAAQGLAPALQPELTDFVQSVRAVAGPATVQAANAATTVVALRVLFGRFAAPTQSTTLCLAIVCILQGASPKNKSTMFWMPLGVFSDYNWLHLFGLGLIGAAFSWYLHREPLIIRDDYAPHPQLQPPVPPIDTTRMTHDLPEADSEQEYQVILLDDWPVAPPIADYEPGRAEAPEPSSYSIDDIGEPCVPVAQSPRQPLLVLDQLSPDNPATTAPDPQPLTQGLVQEFQLRLREEPAQESAVEPAQELAAEPAQGLAAEPALHLATEMAQELAVAPAAEPGPPITYTGHVVFAEYPLEDPANSTLDVASAAIDDFVLVD